MTPHPRLGDCSDVLCARCRVASPDTSSRLDVEAVNDDAELLGFVQAGVRHFTCDACGGIVALQMKRAERGER